MSELLVHNSLMLIDSCPWRRWLSRWTLRSMWAVMLPRWNLDPSDNCWSSPRMTWSSSTWTKSALHWSPHCLRRRSKSAEGQDSPLTVTSTSLYDLYTTTNTKGLVYCNGGQTSLLIGTKPSSLWHWMNTLIKSFLYSIFYVVVFYVARWIPEWEMPWQSILTTGWSSKESKWCQLCYHIRKLTVGVSSVFYWYISLFYCSCDWWLNYYWDTCFLFPV